MVFSLHQRLVGEGTNGRNADDQFGKSNLGDGKGVDCDGETLVIGSINHEFDLVGANSLNNSGAVYVFTKSNENWFFQQKIVGEGTNGRNADDRFGESVSVSGDSMAIAVRRHAFDLGGANSLSNSGAVYVYTRSGSVWSLEQKLVATGINARNALDFFGSSIEIDGNTLVVGADGHDFDEVGATSILNAGAAFVYTRIGSVWSLEQKLAGTGANSRDPNDRFGLRGSTVVGDTIVISSRNGFDATGANFVIASGAAWIFTRTGSIWSLEQRIVGEGTNGRETFDEFGRSISLVGNTVAISSHNDFDATGINSLGFAGAVYVYTRSGSIWSFEQKLVGEGTNGRNENDRFGESLSIQGDQLVAGSRNQSFDSFGTNSKLGAGAVFLFERIGSVWSLDEKLVGEGTNGRNIGDLLGSSLCLLQDGSNIAASAHAYDFDSAGGNPLSASGAVFIYSTTIFAKGGIGVSGVVTEGHLLTEEGEDGALIGGTAIVQSVYNPFSFSDDFRIQQKLVGVGTNGRLPLDFFGEVVGFGQSRLISSTSRQDFNSSGINSVSDAGAVFVFSRSGTVWSLEQRLVGEGTNGRIGNDNFGFYAVISGDTMAVGSTGQDFDGTGTNSINNAGAVFIFTRSGSVWSLQQKIVSDGTNGRKTNDLFGESISLSGNTLVVGARGHDFDTLGANSLEQAGAVFVYTRSGTVWSLEQKLVGDGTNGRKVLDRFGDSVNIDNHTIVVGASSQDFDENGTNSITNAGAIWVFTRSGNVWTKQQKIVATGTNARLGNDRFGLTVSINEDTIVSGSLLQRFDAVGGNSISDAGAAYVFTRSGSVWSQQQKLVPIGTNARGGRFGTDVRLRYNKILVSAALHDFDEDGGNFTNEAGASWLFERIGTIWIQKQKIVGAGTNGRVAGDNLGFSVGLDHHAIALGAKFQKFNEVGGNVVASAGATFVFAQVPEEFGVTLAGEASVVLDEGLIVAEGGISVGLSAGESSSVNVVYDSTPIFLLPQKIVGTGTNGRIGGDELGCSIAVQGDTFIAGAPNHDFDELGGTEKSNSGAAFIYRRSGTGIVLEQKVVGGGTLGVGSKFFGRQAEDKFGISVDVDGDTVVVGAPYQDFDPPGISSLSNSGAVFVYQRVGTTWSLEQKIAAEGTNGRNANDRFGIIAAIDADTLVIGSILHSFNESGTDSVNSAGAVFVYTRSGSVWSLQQKLVGVGTNGRNSSDLFGGSLDLSGDTIVVGIRSNDFDETGTNNVLQSGAAFVYTRTGSLWSLEQKLVGVGTNGRSSFDAFGLSVAIDTDTIVVGATGQDFDSSGASSISSAGAAYVFARSGSAWSLEQKLVGEGTNGRTAGDTFGQGVAISGDNILVGANNHSFDENGGTSLGAAGAAYKFSRSGTIWSFAEKLVGFGTNGRISTDFFGFGLGIDEDLTIVGAKFHDFDENGQNSFPQAGAVYSFGIKVPPTVNVGGEAIIDLAQNTFNEIAEGGILVSVGDTSATIQMVYASLVSLSEDHTFQQKLVGDGTNGRISSDKFGTTVACGQDVIAVGAPEHDFDSVGGDFKSNTGAVYIFNKTSGVWSLSQKLTGEGPNGRDAEDQFGVGLGLSGTTIAVGARFQDWNATGGGFISNTGAVFVFKKDGASWSLEQKIVAEGTNGRKQDDNFGTALSISGDTLAVASPNHDFGVAGGQSLNNAGAVFVFNRNISTWTLQGTFLAFGINSRNANDFFGFDVAIDGAIDADTLAISSIDHAFDENGANSVAGAGAVFVFHKIGNLWFGVQKIVAVGTNGRKIDDAFGYSIALRGDTLIVGAREQDFDAEGRDSLTDAGAAYVFTRTGSIWSFQQKLVGVGTNARITEDLFGFATALGENKAIVTALQQDYDENGENSVMDAGATYIFRRPGSVWNQQQKIVHSFTL